MRLVDVMDLFLVLRVVSYEFLRLLWYQEMWNCPYSNDSFPIYAEDIDAGFDASPSTAMLAEVARKKKVTIVAGSIPERSSGNLYNTCCVFDKNGELKAKFRKVLRPHELGNLLSTAYITVCL